MFKPDTRGLLLTVMLTTCVASAGCATVAAPVLRPIVDHSSAPVWSAKHTVTDGSRNIIWKSSLPGSHKYVGPDIEEASLIDSAEYLNWHWRIVGDPDVLQTYTKWQHSVAHETDNRNAIDNWQSGMRQLYVLTAYLLGTTPLDMDANIILIPDDQAYELAAAQAPGKKASVTIAGHFNVGSYKQSFGEMREILSVLGGQLQREELASGVTAAPPTGKQRTLKDEANSLCWRVAVRAALAVHTDERLKIKNPSSLQMDTAESVLAVMYEKHPNDTKVRTAYAMALVVGGAMRYLTVRHLAWPQTGRDVSGINALLDYCRAFVHYSGDVATQPMPLQQVSPDAFFTVDE